jgi:hypothetical protein
MRTSKAVDVDCPGILIITRSMVAPVKKLPLLSQHAVLNELQGMTAGLAVTRAHHTVLLKPIITRISNDPTFENETRSALPTTGVGSPLEESGGWFNGNPTYALAEGEALSVAANRNSHPSPQAEKFFVEGDPSWAPA